MINKLIYSLILFTPFMLSSCNDDDDVTFVNAPSATGVVSDNEGNTYEWVRIGNLDWTTSNAKNGLPLLEYEFYDNFQYLSIKIPYDENLYDDEEDYIDNYYMPTYGNLMCYADAVASAPDGWRLPTDEDWKALERALGMTDADNKGLRGTNGVSSRLMARDSGVGMALMLGGGTTRRKTFGWMEMSLNSVLEKGFFWTSTIEPSYDESMAYFRKITYGVEGVERQCSQTDNLMSVRWCRNATND